MASHDESFPETHDPFESATDDPSRRELMRGLAAASVGLAATAVGCQRSERVAADAPLKPTSAAGSAGAMAVALSVNGQRVDLNIEPQTSLLDALREHAGLQGTKKGCDHGQCGACTVLIDGRRSLSCMTLAVMHQDKPITTVEGLAKGDVLHPVQAAFIEHDAFQCGYCTPGQICSAVGLINEGRAKTDDDIREGMAGNICRCGAYPGIVAAVRQAITVAGRA